MAVSITFDDGGHYKHSLDLSIGLVHLVANTEALMEAEMNTKPLDYALGATAVADFLIAAWRTAGRVLQAIRNRRQVKDLIELDDRMLKDIGITRYDLRKALNAPLSEDPSAELSSMRAAARRGSGVLHRSIVSDSRPPMSRS